MFLVPGLLLALYIVLVGLLWARTRSWAMVLLNAIVYFYTLHVFGIILLNELGVYDRQDYIFEYPFYAAMNRQMSEALCQQLIFLCTYVAVTVALVPKARHDLDSPPLVVNHWSLVILASVASAVAILAHRVSLLDVWTRGEAAYMSFKRAEVLGSWSPLVRTLFDVALLCALLVVVSHWRLSNLIAPSDQRRDHRAPLILAIVLVGGLALILAWFGDKVALTFSVITCFALVLISPQSKRKQWIVIASFCFALVLINVITYTRHNPEAPTVGGLLRDSAIGILDHGETTASLSQYLVVRSELEPNYGKSFYYLAYSLIPRFIVPNRPGDAYAEYASTVGLPEEVGWGIHYSTDWYLNFGFIGIFLGAAILAWFHAALFRRAKTSGLRALLFSAAIGSLPLGIRSGVQGFKMMLISLGLAWIVSRVCKARLPAPTPRVQVAASPADTMQPAP